MLIGRLIVFALMIPVLAICADVSILDNGLQISGVLGGGFFDGGFDYSTLFEAITIIGTFAKLVTIYLSIPKVLGVTFFLDAPAFSQPGIPQIIRNAALAQAENHSPFVLRFIRRR